MSDLKRLIRDYVAASAERSRIYALKDGYIREELSKARQKASELFDAALESATKEESRTRRLREEEEARLTSMNPLVGRTVQKKKYGSYGYRLTDKGFEQGVLEVMTHDTEVPSNLKYSKPSIGDLFVRILKSDGTPSKRVDRYSGHNWKLVESSELEKA